MAHELLVRHMHSGDIADGMRLKQIAGWNQSASDWQGYLSLEPKGCFVAERQGKVLATATAINYQSRFGWIGMILVDPPARRQGIATRMMEETIGYLESLSCQCQKLDATEAGAQVYAKMGFETEYQVERWSREPGRSLKPEKAQSPIQDLSPDRISSIAAYDSPIFGASRDRLLRWLSQNQAPGFFVGEEGDPKGFLLSKNGSNAFHLGPVVASDLETARVLVHSALAQAGDRPAIVDVITNNEEACRLFRSYGFKPIRLLFRMFRGQNLHPGHPDLVYALAGFEFG